MGSRTAAGRYDPANFSLLIKLFDQAFGFVEHSVNGIVSILMNRLAINVIFFEQIHIHPNRRRCSGSDINCQCPKASLLDAVFKKKMLFGFGIKCSKHGYGRFLVHDVSSKHFAGRSDHVVEAMMVEGGDLRKDLRLLEVGGKKGKNLKQNRRYYLC